MHVRVVRFTGVSAERIGSSVERIQQSGGPPPGVRAKGLDLLYDEDQETAVVLQYFESVEDMQAAGAVLGAMDASETPGARASVDVCETRLEMKI
jgi:copper homeostasis protein CutC